MRETPSAATNERAIGERVKDRYRLVSVLGAGAQAAVYRAFDERESREVAVKMLHAHRKDDATAHERLMREAHVLALLADTAAIRMLDQAITRDGRFCLITELLEGQDLESALRALESQSREPTVRELARVFRPVVETLERAHANGIVHRDVKPANVFLERAGKTSRIRLLDFGLAKLMRLPRVTATGMITGSPSYIAPETWDGQPTTACADVYALGSTIFRFLAGRPPFLGAGPIDVMRKATHDDRPSLRAFRPDLPPGIDAWVERALAIRPDDRFPSAGSLYRGLEDVFAG